MMRRLPPTLRDGRLRTSTVLLSALFVAVLALYLLVRPVPETGPSSRRDSGTAERSRSPSDTTPPATPAPTATTPTTSTTKTPTKTSTTKTPTSTTKTTPTTTSTAPRTVPRPPPGAPPEGSTTPSP